MKIKTLIAKNFRSIKDIHLNNLDTKNIISLVGKNGAGKSSILKVIEYNLTGEIPDSGSEQQNIYTMIEYVINNKLIKVERGIGEYNTLVIFIDGVAVRGRKGEVQNEIEKIIGFDKSYFKHIIYFEQMAFQSFIQMKPTQKKEQLREWLGLNFWDEVQEKVKQELKEGSKNVYGCESQIDTIISHQNDIYLDLSDYNIIKLNKSLINKQNEFTVLEKFILTAFAE